MQLKYLNRPFKLKAVDDTGRIEGYGAVFGNVDSYKHVVMPGAFLESIAAHKQAGTAPKLLWQHNPEMPIGVWDDIYEDETGLVVKGRLLLDVRQAQEAYALLKGGALDGLSIGYQFVDDTFDRDTGILYLNKVDLWETSLVTFAANDLAKVTSVKNKPATKRELEHALQKLLGYTKSEAEILSRHGYQALEGLRDEPPANEKDADDLRDEVLTTLRKTHCLLQAELTNLNSRS